jgi:hypothetical protein
MMEMRLTEEEIMKLISVMSTEEIEEKLDANYSYWDVEKVSVDTFSLKKKVDE